jgi:hypothetical protein
MFKTIFKKCKKNTFLDFFDYFMKNSGCAFIYYKASIFLTCFVIIEIFDFNKILLFELKS